MGDMGRSARKGGGAVMDELEQMDERCLAILDKLIAKKLLRKPEPRKTFLHSSERDFPLAELSKDRRHPYRPDERTYRRAMPLRSGELKTSPAP